MRTRLLVIAGVIIVAILAIFIISNTKSKNLFLSGEESREKTDLLRELLNRATQQEANGNLPEAQSLYKKLVNDFPNSSQVDSWQKKVWDLNIRLLFSPAITPGSVLYEIQPGDSLAKIAKKFNTTVGLLERSNNLSDSVIITGKTLKVWTKPFSIVVDKSQNILILKSDDEVIKIYVVSTGINNSTPVGTFRIVNKLINPPWFKSGKMIPPESPDNILGSRWMGFDLAGYGIHGTTEPQSLGRQITQGCVRMSNSDVEELFAIVHTGTEVTIVD